MPARPALFLFVLGLLIAATVAEASPNRQSIEVRTRPIRNFAIGDPQSTFGQLTFLGGLEITSEAEEFGSFSGLDFDAQGRLHAVTDRGQWFSAILMEDNHVPAGLADTWMAPLRDSRGDLPSSKVGADAESLRIAEYQGRVAALVSFERIHEIRVFDLPNAPSATPRNVPLPDFVRGLKTNQGLEAIAIAPPDSALAGALVALAERSTDRAGNHRGFIVDGPLAGTFSIGRTDDFDITDAEFLPDGDLLILERRFSFSRGLAIRLRRIRGSLIRPNRIVDGTIVLEAGMGHQIDNLEGLAVRNGDNGSIILTLVSDDNHNFLQRTLLLQFRLNSPVIPLPRSRPESDDVR